MDVIRHQRVREDFHSVWRAVLADEVQVTSIVLVAEEGPLAANSPLREMVNVSRNDQSSVSRHSAKTAFKARAMTTPNRVGNIRDHQPARVSI